MRDPEARAYVGRWCSLRCWACLSRSALLLQTAIHDLIHLVWEVIPEELGWSEPAWWYVILVPGLAGLLVAAAVGSRATAGTLPLEPWRRSRSPRSRCEHPPGGASDLGLGLVLGPEAP